MSYKCLIVLPFIFLGAFAQGKYRTAVSLDKVLELTHSQDLAFKDRGLVFGYDTLQSCLYADSDVSVLRHYCFPDKKRPARAITLVSRQFGMIYLYEEDQGSVIRREVMIESFPEDLTAIDEGPYRDWSVADWNLIYKNLYYSPQAACWSTNYSQYKKRAESACYGANINDFSDWSQETMSLVQDPVSWNLMFQKLEKKL